MCVSTSSSPLSLNQWGEEGIASDASLSTNQQNEQHTQCLSTRPGSLCQRSLIWRRLRASLVLPFVKVFKCCLGHGLHTSQISAGPKASFCAPSTVQPCVCGLTVPFRAPGVKASAREAREKHTAALSLTPEGSLVAGRLLRQHCLPSSRSPRSATSTLGGMTQDAERTKVRGGLGDHMGVQGPRGDEVPLHR